MAGLQDLLSQLVGQDAATRALQNELDYRKHFNQGSANVSSQAGKYFTSESPNVQTIPKSEFKRQDAAAYYTPIGNMLTLQKRQAGLESGDLASLVHELQHYKDELSKKNSMNTREGDDKTLQAIRDRINKYKDSIVDTQRDYLELLPRNEITGQQETYEQIPQLAGFESQLPAGMNLMQSRLGKMFTPEQKALIIRKMNPLPEGVDAIVGGY